ncbi:proteinase inhibitor I3 [Artemisia annua]|uniref:Proteinase inhibitor I3 n=1 Tax=Artemisia annua TaxID=35608 RepID=A0A2U1NL69_ARTAN|nr:proteinase inhibitor I3 [Artemisia annua]
MKLFILAFILFALSANSAPSPVLDAYGKNLRTGVEYYVMPAAGRGESGLLRAAVGGNDTCPAGVAQFRADQYGDPLTFTPVNPKKGLIRLSTDVNIKFSGSTMCHESNVWKLKYDKNMKQYAVMMGGVEGNRGPKTLDNWFKIEKTKDGYKFVFCPSVCSTCKVTCKDLGIVVDVNGRQRLAVRKYPLSVIFYK